MNYFQIVVNSASVLFIVKRQLQKENNIRIQNLQNLEESLKISIKFILCQFR